MESEEFPPKTAALLGQAAKLNISESLATRGVTFIHQFQDEHGLRDPSCRVILPLFDLLGVTRPAIYESLLTHLRTQLIERLPSLTLSKLSEILEITWEYLDMPAIRAIPIQILQLHPEIPQKYLKVIASNTTLYDNCTIEVQRQIWRIYRYFCYIDLT